MIPLSNALWLFVICPKTRKMKRVTECLECDKYTGQMYDDEGTIKSATALNCELLER